MKRSRRQQRFSDAPSEPPESESARAIRLISLGCGATVAIALLVGALVGFGVFLTSRFVDVPAVTGRGGAGADEPPLDPSGLPVPTYPGAGDPGATPPVVRDAMAEMRRRYVPGPHVRVEGMIPSDRTYATTGATSPWQSARSADTPWMVLGALYERGAPPGPSSGAAPTIVHAPGEDATRPIDVIANVPAAARVGAMDAHGGPDVMHYLVSFDGYPGHFSLPVRVQTELGPVAASGSEGATVRFTIGSAQRPDRSVIQVGQSFVATMRIQAVDSSGRVSPAIARQVNIVPAGQGDVEVAMTMSLATDLDLYVTDPSGTTVYYGNRDVFSGGHLDLDANAACSGNRGVQAEHVYWPEGRAPAGNYTVRVAHYMSCVQGRPIDYRVTVRACGETVVLTGRFTGSGRGASCMSTPDDPVWCQEVVSFQVPNCAAL